MSAASAVGGVSGRANAFKTIVWGGLTAAVLDGSYAVIILGWARGHSTLSTFQFIASGLLGPAAFPGGWGSGSIGVVCHVVIAMGAAAVFYGISLLWPGVLGKPVLYGGVFGLGVFLFMHYIVVPLSAVPKSPTRPGTYLSLVLAHVICVGIPIAMMASCSAKRSELRLPSLEQEKAVV